ncbi:M20 family metallopeptidase [uncultured Acetobacteroides sp.]|uniref:M20 metallopeptidase family protein n=1 Tax=uncultured Acetobacteroides sp. TaxID=1760811 RepID=UPI0029F5753E|nr:M20 family metallopeptidase [uncultured Acetobacteroides sp.]
MINLDQIKQEVTESYDWATSIFRYLHQHPELSFEEHETSKFIANTLRKIGITDITSVAGTGLLAAIEGSKEGKSIGLRADIDALPIQEETNLPYASANSGCMHACGHDMHTAVLLSAAKVLWKNRHNIEGTIYLLFQPGEEMFPGGASKVLESGILDSKGIEAFAALHVSPEIETGKVGIRPGMYMASGDEIHIEVKGKGGHAALPHTLDDTVLAASSIVVNLQQLVSRIGDTRIPTVLSIGKFIANGATNIIPSTVKLEGTFRTMNEEWRAKAHQRITEVIESTAKAYHTEAIVDIKKGYPCLINNPQITSKARATFIENLGIENVIDLDIRMTTEDFGFISNRYPSVFFRLGVGGVEGSSGMLHNGKFIANEKALKTGTFALITLAKSLLE